MPARVCDDVEEQDDAAAVRALVDEPLPPRARALRRRAVEDLVARRRARAVGEVGYFHVLEAVDDVVVSAAVGGAGHIDHRFHPAHVGARLAALAHAPALAVDEDAALAHVLVDLAPAVGLIGGFIVRGGRGAHEEQKQQGTGARHARTGEARRGPGRTDTAR